MSGFARHLATAAVVAGVPVLAVVWTVGLVTLQRSVRVHAEGTYVADVPYSMHGRAERTPGGPLPC